MTPHRLARPGAALALALMFGALVTQACERKPEREPALAARVTGASIDREERKGKGASDHAPVVVDLD